MTGRPSLKEQYGHKYESFHDLVVVEGKSFQPPIEDDPSIKGEMQQCFHNAWQAAMDDPDLTYVEGFASGIIPVHHAWVTRDGKHAIEVTWESGNGYYGIPMKTDWVTARLMRRGYTGVFGDFMDKEAQGWFTEGFPDAAKA